VGGKDKELENVSLRVQKLVASNDFRFITRAVANHVSCLPLPSDDLDSTLEQHMYPSTCIASEDQCRISRDAVPNMTPLYVGGFHHWEQERGESKELGQYWDIWSVLADLLPLKYLHRSSTHE
jgi:hypothetical protein